MEEHARALTNPTGEEGGMTKRQLHGLKDRALGLCLTTHIFPAHVGHARSSDGRRAERAQPARRFIELHVPEAASL